jgi:hypothetical protein
MYRQILNAIEDGTSASFVRAASTSALQYHAPTIRFAPDNMETIDAITYLAQSDILLLSPSDFSYASCVFNTRALKMGIGYGPQFHGCHNHIRLLYTRIPQDLPAAWRDHNFIPESAFTAHQNISLYSIANFTERLLDSVHSLDEKRQAGLYPYDQQLPTFISEHRSFIADQLDGDRTMGFITQRDEPTVQRLEEWFDTHSTNRTFDDLWYYNHIFY